MRKSVLFITLLVAISMAANAQKFALIDTEYIMKNIPAAQSANEQMQEATKKYQDVYKRQRMYCIGSFFCKRNIMFSNSRCLHSDKIISLPM